MIITFLYIIVFGYYILNKSWKNLLKCFVFFLSFYDVRAPKNIKCLCMSFWKIKMCLHSLWTCKSRWKLRTCLYPVSIYVYLLSISSSSYTLNVLTVLPKWVCHVFFVCFFSLWSPMQIIKSARKIKRIYTIQTKIVETTNNFVCCVLYKEIIA